MVAPVLRAAAPRILSDLLKFEVDASYVRELAPLGAGQATEIGTPLGKVADTGTMVVLNPAANDGSQNCAGLALFARPAPAADLNKGCTYLARGPAIVADSGILWPAGVTDVQKLAALAALEARGIVVRPAY